MLKNALKVLHNCRTLAETSKVNIHASSASKEKWDLLTAILLERKPVITPALNELEKEFKDYLAAVEYERSIKSDTELKIEQEKKILSLRKDADDMDLVVKNTTQDFIDAYKEELAKFKAADRITDADRKNDQKSLKRRLDKHLVLVTGHKLGKDELYLLPQGKIEGNESLRDCANRILKDICGNEVKVQIFGNAPCGFYKYKYPKNVQGERNMVGAKVFIYFARYISGQLEKQSTDYKWLDKDELGAVLPADYKNSVLPLLIED